jgi:hypothetical protein
VCWPVKRCRRLLWSIKGTSKLLEKVKAKPRSPAWLPDAADAVGHPDAADLNSLQAALREALKQPLPSRYQPIRNATIAQLAVSPGAPRGFLSNDQNFT